MNRKYVYYILSLALLSCFLILIFFAGNNKEQAAQNVKVANPPFRTYISATGIVEPASGNIMITSPFNRMIEKINVKVNEQVKKGDILFQLYNQDYIDNLKIKQSALR